MPSLSVSIVITAIAGIALAVIIGIRLIGITDSAAIIRAVEHFVVIISASQASPCIIVRIGLACI